MGECVISLAPAHLFISKFHFCCFFFFFGLWLTSGIKSNWTTFTWNIMATFLNKVKSKTSFVEAQSEIIVMKCVLWSRIASHPVPETQLLLSLGLLAISPNMENYKPLFENHVQFYMSRSSKSSWVCILWEEYRHFSQFWYQNKISLSTIFEAPLSVEMLTPAKYSRTEFKPFSSMTFLELNIGIRVVQNLEFSKKKKIELNW